MSTVAATKPPEPTPAERIEAISFAYRAQSRDGEPISGTVEAADLDDAGRKLRGMGLRALEVAPAE